MAKTLETDARWSQLILASEQLATCRSLDDVVAILRDTAREVVGAAGIAVIVRENDKCFYAAEDAIGALWAGSRFPMEACVSGWAMAQRQTVAISDIRVDSRIPQEAYQPTFVRSLVMAPIGSPEPIGAIGAYWPDVRDHEPASIARLEALARSAAIAIENARLLAAAQESERQRTLALTAGRMGVWSLDLFSGELETSATCRENFGRDPQLPFSYADLQAAIHPEDKQGVSQAIERSLASGGDYDIEYRLVTPAGETRWIGIRAQPTLSREGTPLLLAGVSIDITDRKRLEAALKDSAATLEHLVEERTRELVATQDALRQSRKLEAMGQLTGGVAHDFNNLLTPIIGSLDLLQRRAVGGEREQRLISGALDSADRAKTLVQRLLAFARRQPLSSASIDVADLLRQLSPLLETTIGPQIRLQFDIAEDIARAHADPNQVEMAILNLAVNARDAMPDGGHLTIAAKMGRGIVDDRTGLRDDHYVLLSVSDDGSGMDEATQARAIEPFFSTKEIGHGTGLGLSMVHGLALQLGGALTISSAIGVGTTVKLWLPVSEEQYTPSPRAGEVGAPRAAGVALLVDDELLVRAVTADMLADLGYHVCEASDGQEALDMLKQMPQVDLLVTDHMMPRMTGVELVEIAREIRPDLGVLVVSGYCDVIRLAPDVPRLEKPFRQADLVAALAKPKEQAKAPCLDGI